MKSLKNKPNGIWDDASLFNATRCMGISYGIDGQVFILSKNGIEL
jgi:hypothetical protein